MTTPDMIGPLFLLADAELFNLFAARMQMAFTLGAHIILACLGVGMPVLLLFAEWRSLCTGDASWRNLSRRWSKAFAVLFAVGAVSGTVLSFELGLLWPSFMGTFGSVIGLPFTLEGFAFFLEAIFAGIYLYGWDRLSPRVHWLAGFPIAISGFASAWFVVTANSWMNSPQGFVLRDGVVVEADPWAAMFNPATGAQTAHMILAAYMVTGFLVAAFYAWEILRGRAGVYQRRALGLGLALAAICTPAQIVVGDWAAKVVAASQPVKLAAIEGQFETQANAPLRIGGWPDEHTRQTPFAVEIPGMLSWLAHGDASATVQGLDDFPRHDTPPVLIVHLAFQMMVGCGIALALVSAWAGISVWRRKRLPSGRIFLWSLVISGPLAVLALEAGWVVTEVGRQPWIVQGVMRTADAVTAAPGIGCVLAVTLLIYGVITAGTILVLRLLARVPLTQEAGYGS